MKAFSISVALTFTLIAALWAQPASSPESAPDPIVGNWIWRGDHFVTISPDGTAASRKGPRATWKYLKNREVERRYEFVWDGGQGLDVVTLQRSGQKLDVKDQNNVKFVVPRAPAHTR